jgi:hypothetical protein
MNEKIYQRLIEMRHELNNIVNSFGGNVTGAIAVELHGATNRISVAQRMMLTGITVEDTNRIADEWCDKQLIPMGLWERELIKSLLR